MLRATRTSGRSAAASGSSIGRRMTDDRPRPKYGEYGPVAPAPVEPAPTPVAVAPPAPNRTRDIVITTLLLLVGVYDVVTGFSGFASLGAALAQAYEIQGISGFASRDLANQVGAGINMAKVAVLILTIALSLLLIARHRRAFWVPLAGGLLAFLIVTAGVLVVILQDPALLAWAETQSP